MSAYEGDWGVNLSKKNRRKAASERPVPDRYIDGKHVCGYKLCKNKHLSLNFCSDHYKAWRDCRLDDVKLKYKKASSEFASAPRICSHPGCSSAHYSKGYCSDHYRRNRLGQNMGAPIRRHKTYASCPVPARFLDGVHICGYKNCSNLRYALNLCHPHYKQYRYGSLADVDMKYNNKASKTCSYPGCEAIHYALGHCRDHYRKDRIGKDMDAPVRRRRAKARCLMNGSFDAT